MLNFYFNFNFQVNGPDTYAGFSSWILHLVWYKWRLNEFNEFNILLAFTFEFIGLGYGFGLAPEHILRNCYETRDGVIAMVSRARALGYMNVRP